MNESKQGGKLLINHSLDLRQQVRTFECKACTGKPRLLRRL